MRRNLQIIAALILAAAAGCAQQAQDYRQDKPIEAQVAPNVEVCLGMTMAGCEPAPEPTGDAFDDCESQDPLTQQEEGCFVGGRR